MSEIFENLWKLRKLQDKFVSGEIETWLNNEFLTLPWWIPALSKYQIGAIIIKNSR